MSRRFFFGGRKRSSSAPKAMEPAAPTELPKRQSAIRRSMRRIRKSFKKEKGYVPAASKPHIYAKDEKAVRNSDCSFSVKYLGAIEVTESRGMSVCEEAAKKLRLNPQHKVRAVLQVSGDALRVVEEGGQGLLVDQTIEKVSFCAPDRYDDRGFSYISRDGTTRRWLCHCFLSMKEPGERLSHAVGCAFAACLERKQARDKLCGVEVEFDVNKTSFTRQGSFKQTTMTEQLAEEAQKEAQKENTEEDQPSPAAKPVVNPYAIPRRHATDEILERQGSFRGFPVLNNNTPFKRNLSLRLNELPSTLQRQNQILETVPDMSPTSPTKSSHGMGVLTEHPEHHSTPTAQSQIHAQVHTGNAQKPQVTHPVVFTQKVTPPPGYGTPPPKPQPIHPFGQPSQKPVQPAISAQQPVQQPPVNDTNPWGNPQSYNPWGDAVPPAATAKPSKSEAEKWLEDTSKTVTQKTQPQVNGEGAAAAMSVNHNNANIASPKAAQNGTGINGSWVADISHSLQAADSGRTNGHTTAGAADPEFEAKWAHSPKNKPGDENPFGNAVKTFEINL